MFSISELENFSGVKKHTIRIWEQRYAILQPKRSEGNTRYYSLAEVQVLLNLTLLNRHGYRISDLVKMNDAALNQAIRSIKDTRFSQEKAVHKLILSMFSLEIEEFEALLDTCVLSWGIGETMQCVVIPFLEKVQVMSYADTSSEVHFIVTAVRRKIILAIESAKNVPEKNITVLLFLPGGEHYDLMLLYLNYCLKKSGARVLYMGTNISCENLKSAAAIKNPSFLCTYLNNMHLPKSRELINEFHLHFPEHSLIVAQPELDLPVSPAPRVEFVHYGQVATIFEAGMSYGQGFQISGHRQ